MHIAPYEEGNRFNHDPLRSRKLLLHKKEIIKLGERTRNWLFTYSIKTLFKNMVKVLLGVARGKKTYSIKTLFKTWSM